MGQRQAVTKTIATRYPLQVDSGPDGSEYVADAFLGQVVKISRKGVTSVVWSGQPGTFSPGIGVQGGTLFVTASTEPDEGNPYGRADLLRVAPNGKTTKVVDLLAYELAVNPDGQRALRRAVQPLRRPRAARPHADSRRWWQLGAAGRRRGPDKHLRRPAGEYRGRMRQPAQQHD